MGINVAISVVQHSWIERKRYRSKLKMISVFFFLINKLKSTIVEKFRDYDKEKL